MRKAIGIPMVMLLASCAMDEPKPIVTGLEGMSMQEFSILLPDSSHYFSSAELSGNKPTVLFYFSPTCPYCRIQTRRIVEDVQELDDINFLFVTSNQFDVMKKYYRHFGLEGLDNVQVGLDTGYVVANYFKTTKVPSVALYDANRRLTSFYTGVVKTETMKKLLN